MNKINPTSALYIKLGEGGEYEKECLAAPGTIHIGWREIPQELCILDDWDEVRRLLLSVYNGNEGTATNQTNQLKLFYKSGMDTLWITFRDDCLYWCFTDPAITVLKDNSRVRQTLDGWHNFDINGVKLDTSRLSGSLLSVQGYRSVICNVREFSYLLQKINGETTPAEQKAMDARSQLISSLENIIHHLNWKEFELLTDLIFRQAGWQRLNVVGKTQKDIDLDLLSPIDEERYRVQVKSRAGMREFQDFLNLAVANQEFARYYFVVHQPNAGLQKNTNQPLVKVWFSDDIARLAVNYGLVDWLIAKAK